MSLTEPATCWRENHRTAAKHAVISPVNCTGNSLHQELTKLYPLVLQRESFCWKIDSSALWLQQNHLFTVLFLRTARLGQLVTILM